MDEKVEKVGLGGNHIESAEIPLTESIDRGGTKSFLERNE